VYKGSTFILKMCRDQLVVRCSNIYPSSL